LLIYSTFADPPLDVVRAKVDHPLILGLYVRGDQAWLDEAVDQAKAAGCVAITVVTEAPYYSRRERDLINRFRSRGSKSGTYAATQKVLREGGTSEAVAAAEARMVTARLTWKTIERIRQRSSLPVILKGISTAEDARLAVEHGASAVYISTTAAGSSIARVVASKAPKSSTRSPAGRSSWMAASIAARTC
jgi:isopentenyl diphosphate isomerase/L-lactate dehydrogenase-like FMN-dependent dehydrogenase